MIWVFLVFVTSNGSVNSSLTSAWLILFLPDKLPLYKIDNLDLKIYNLKKGINNWIRSGNKISRLSY